MLNFSRFLYFNIINITFMVNIITTICHMRRKQVFTHLSSSIICDKDSTGSKRDKFFSVTYLNFFHTIKRSMRLKFERIISCIWIWFTMKQRKIENVCEENDWWLLIIRDKKVNLIFSYFNFFPFYFIYQSKEISYFSYVML